MTNEELVIEIKNGNNRLIDDLWTGVEKFVCLQANKYYISKKERLAALGCTEDDLVQVGFLAVIDAIAGFDTERETTFLTYLGYHLQRHFTNSACLDSSGRQKQANMIVSARSFDDTVAEDKDGNTLTVADIIADPDAEADMYAFIERDEQEQLKTDLSIAISNLQSVEATIITKHYFESVPVCKLADELGISNTRAQHLRTKALKTLRADKRVKKYAFQFKKKQLEDRYSRGFSYRQFRETGMSSQEMYMIKLEELEKAFGLS